MINAITAYGSHIAFWHLAERAYVPQCEEGVFDLLRDMLRPWVRENS